MTSSSAVEQAPALGTSSVASEVQFAQGLPGFPGPRRFALIGWGDTDGPFSVMVDLDAPGVRFLVVPPHVFFPDYEVDLDDAVVDALSLRSAEECLLLVIVALGDRPQDATANLLGPLVVNVRTREGMQAVLNDTTFSTRTPLHRS